jgi:hypothetical protein
LWSNQSTDFLTRYGEIKPSPYSPNQIGTIEFPINNRERKSNLKSITMTLPARILLTGAAGRVGQALRPILREQYDQVLLSDLKEIDDCQGSESFKQGDIADFEFVKSLAGACEGVVHLAGLVGSKFTFEENVGPNYVGTHNISSSEARGSIIRRLTGLIRNTD